MGRKRYRKTKDVVAEAHGLKVSVLWAKDGVPLVIIDTDPEVDDSPEGYGPAIRVQINDGPLYPLAHDL
jgi:hypothetical protein